MMAGSGQLKNLHFDNQSKQFTFLVFVAVFLKEIENIILVFLSRDKNTHESLGELEKAVETIACSCSHNTRLLVFPQPAARSPYFLQTGNLRFWTV